LILCCPFDERDAYKADGKVYDAGGSVIGAAAKTSFVASRGGDSALQAVEVDRK
jgi:hypothetical protein